MKIETRTQDRVAVLRLSGKHAGQSGASDLHEAVKAAIAGGRRQVLLDCEALEWINSNGIGQIIAACHTLRRVGGSLKICALTGRAAAVFSTCQLERVLDIRASRQEALAAFLAEPVSGALDRNRGRLLPGQRGQAGGLPGQTFEAQ